MISLVILSAVAICESAFVDILYQCSKDDGKCQAMLLKEILDKIASNGAPELDIPPTDPVELKNMNFSIPNVVDVVIDGVATGARNCAVNMFTANVDDGVAKIDLVCNITVKAKYKLSSSSPILRDLFGGHIHGDGNGKIKIEKFNLKLEIPFDVVRRGEDIFLDGNRTKVTFTFDILGKVAFAADSIYLGEKESSEMIVQLLNENWKLIVGSFGNNIVDIVIDFVYNILRKFFANVPVKYYFKEDLSSYVQE